jgi:hypothetical protein
LRKLADDDARDQIAADHEEHVNPEVAATENLEAAMKQDDREHCDGS